MSILSKLTGLLSPFTTGVEVIKWVGKEVVSWAQNRSVLKAAELELKLAEVKAQTEIAAWKVKSDIEWDLKWADQAGKSWKDEFLLILWSIPLVGMFFPFTRPFVQDGFLFMKEFNPDAAYWYMAGWAIIFAASFGFKQAANFMLPGRIGQMVTAMGSITPDVPEKITAAAQNKINEALAKGREGLF